MKLAVLFFFYKDIEVCEDRLSLLRKLNPDISIFGLYGGPLDNLAEMPGQLAHHFDDLYVFEAPQDLHWKWRHGDQLLSAWHRDRGERLTWDTIVVVQWDMLVLEPIADAFAMLGEGHMLLSGLRPVAEVERWWIWVRRNKRKNRDEFERFMAYAEETFGFREEALCALFIVVCLPRRFLDRYVSAAVGELGFLEYKIPTLAQAFGVPFCRDHPYTPWWANEPATRWVAQNRRLLNTVDKVLDLNVIRAELERPGGQRIIHPFRSKRPSWMG